LLSKGWVDKEEVYLKFEKKKKAKSKKRKNKQNALFFEK
jgi:hypothetical protein